MSTPRVRIRVKPSDLGEFKRNLDLVRKHPKGSEMKEHEALQMASGLTWPTEGKGLLQGFLKRTKVISRSMKAIGNPGGMLHNHGQWWEKSGYGVKDNMPPPFIAPLPDQGLPTRRKKPFGGGKKYKLSELAGNLVSALDSPLTRDIVAKVKRDLGGGGCGCESKGGGCACESKGKKKGGRGFFTNLAGKQMAASSFKEGQGYIHHKHSKGEHCHGHKHHQGMAGDGYITDKITKLISKVAAWVAPSDMSGKVKRFMEVVKNFTIKSITVCRIPITKAVEFALRKIATVPAQYDKIYHLYMVIALSNGASIRVERNQQFEINNASPQDLNQPRHELPEGVTGNACVPVPMKGVVQTMGVAMDGFIKQAKLRNPELGPWRYAGMSTADGAPHNNCQDMVTSWLTGMGLMTPTLSTFINQDIDKLLGVNGTKLAQAATDLAGAFGTSILGRGDEHVSRRQLHSILA